MAAAIFHTILNAKLTLPALEVFLLIGLLNLAFLLRFPRCGIIIAYGFVYRWCWPTVSTWPSEAKFYYVVFGLFAASLAIYEMLNDR